MIFKKDAKIKNDLDGNSYEDTITSPKEFDKIKNIYATKLFYISEDLDYTLLIYNSFKEYNDSLIRKRTESISHDEYVAGCLKIVMTNSKGSMNTNLAKQTILDLLNKKFY